MVSSSTQVLRPLRCARHPEGLRGQRERGQVLEARREHHRGLRRKVRARSEYNANSLQQWIAESDTKVPACQVQIAAIASS